MEGCPRGEGTLRYLAIEDKCWIMTDVWDDDVYELEGGSLGAWLDEGESRMFWLRPC